MMAGHAVDEALRVMCMKMAEGFTDMVLHIVKTKDETFEALRDVDMTLNSGDGIPAISASEVDKLVAAAMKMQEAAKEKKKKKTPATRKKRLPKDTQSLPPVLPSNKKTIPKSDTALSLKAKKRIKPTVNNYRPKRLSVPQHIREDAHLEDANSRQEEYLSPSPPLSPPSMSLPLPPRALPPRSMPVLAGDYCEEDYREATML